MRKKEVLLRFQSKSEVPLRCARKSFLVSQKESHRLAGPILACTLLSLHVHICDSARSAHQQKNLSRMIMLRILRFRPMHIAHAYRWELQNLLQSSQTRQSNQACTKKSPVTFEHAEMFVIPLKAYRRYVPKEIVMSIGVPASAMLVRVNQELTPRRAWLRMNVRMRLKLTPASGSRRLAK